MFLVFASEIDIDAALILLGSCYKYQRLDNKWITQKPEIVPENLPEYLEESESLTWYPSDSREYHYLHEELCCALEIKLDAIDVYYNTIKREFTKENILMEITQLGQTQLVLDAFEQVDYAMRQGSVFAACTHMDSIVRSSPFLTDERINTFKNSLLTYVGTL